MNVVDLQVFKQALRILKGNTFENVIDSLQSLRSHLELVESEYEMAIGELKHILVHFKKFENQMKYRMVNIDAQDIRPWVPLLKKHQKAAIYPEVKSDTVSRLINSKRELDNIDYSIEELKLRVGAVAKLARESSNKVKRTKKQIFVLETAADIEGFLNMNEYKAAEIADYEVEKYFDIYKKGR